MPYHIDIDTDWDRGREQYTITVLDELDRATARHLGDWLADAMQNPNAAFVLDLSRASAVSGAALVTMASRHHRLLVQRRLEIVRPQRTPAAVQVTALPALLLLADAAPF